MRAPRAIVVLSLLFAIALPSFSQVKVGAAADAASGSGQVGTTLNSGGLYSAGGVPAVNLVAPLALTSPAPLSAPAPSVALNLSPSALTPSAAAVAAQPKTARAVPAVVQAQGAALPSLSPAAFAQKTEGGAGDASPEKKKFDADALFDARAQKLPADEAINMIISGFRFGDEGRLLAPNGGAPVTNGQLKGYLNAVRDQRGRAALLRLETATSPGATGETKQPLIEANKASLPREVVKTKDPEKQRSVILRRLASIYRRWMAKPAAPELGAVQPANAEAEERIGALVAAAATKRFAADPEGRRLLDQLKDAGGKPRMPVIRVLRLDERYGALYYSGQLIISLDYLKKLLAARASDAERGAVEKALSTEAGALEYLSSRPERVDAALDAADVVIFHELVHFMQDLTRPLMKAAGSERTPAVVALEHEYEAYSRQNLYIHSRLGRPDASLSIDGLHGYLQFISDFESWRAGIETNYKKNFPNGFLGLDELADLQGRSLALQKRLGDADASLPSLKPDKSREGAAAIAKEKALTGEALRAIRASWPSLAKEGFRHWADLNAKLGRPHEAATAYLRLAGLLEEEAKAAALRKADQYTDQALLRLAAPEGLALDERIAWINSLAAIFNARGTLWKKELWVACFRDYPAKAEALRADAAKAADAGTREGLLATARQFDDMAGQNRATLRGFAEKHLAMAKSEADAGRLRALIEWGSMEAGVLGDAGLIEAFKALPVPR
jgi:hypothetical protein